MPEKLIKVYPSSKLADTEYIPGVSPEGSEIPQEQADALGELVVKSKPKSSPDEPAEKPEE